MNQKEGQVMPTRIHVGCFFKHVLLTNEDANSFHTFVTFVIVVLVVTSTIMQVNSHTSGRTCVRNKEENHGFPVYIFALGIFSVFATFHLNASKFKQTKSRKPEE